MRELHPVPPAFVKDGPIMEEVQTGNDVNLLKFPTPFVAEKDGGRYIWTCDSIINYEGPRKWPHKSMSLGHESIHWDVKKIN